MEPQLILTRMWQLSRNFKLDCVVFDYIGRSRMFYYCTTTHSHIPELAPCDYHLFGKLKDPFAERGKKMTPLCTLQKSGSDVLVQTFTVLVYRPSFLGYLYRTMARMNDLVDPQKIFLVSRATKIGDPFHVNFVDPGHFNNFEICHDLSHNVVTLLRYVQNVFLDL
ncbi:hypothetical protein ANN_02904 [Periplaneta americana]|uniref:Uncharacterized protein n=1 Tax=Periplaneta americana TaxID=6978 RepID=A0ABQ8U0M8_PERAM|nr:hypothetical protein ANN_02904 [Periplaneta americana]